MTINETDIDAIIELLSKQRLSPITEFVKSKKLVIDIHQEILSLNGTLMSIVATIEIALRNTVYQNLNQYFNANNRLFQPPVPFEWRDAEKGKLTKALNHAKDAVRSKATIKDANNATGDTIVISDDDLIAQLAFSFWKRVYASEYEESLWYKTLKKTFPNETIMRDLIVKHLETINKTRNRLAHHEPVLFERLKNTIGAIQFIAQNLNQPAPNPDSPLAKLLSRDIKKITKQAENLHTMMNRPTNP